MRIPARFVANNLIWATDGSVWAAWRVEPVSYPYLSAREKLQLHSRTRTVLMSLASDAMVLSVCRRLDAHDVVGRMADGVDLDRCPQWREQCSATLDALGQVHLYGRLHYLVVRLPDLGTIQGMRQVLAGAGAGVAEAFGLPPVRVRRAEAEARSRQAAQVEAQLRTFVGVRPATAGEILWLFARAYRRGLDEPFLADSWEPRIRTNGEGPDAPLAGPSLATLGEALIKEGGNRTDPDRPRHRRYLRVETAIGVAYQAFLAMADMPARFAFPGGAGEWFFHADELAFPVDWCARIRVVANQEAQVKARRQARQLAAQVEEYEGEPSGIPQSLHEAWEGVDSERAELASSPADPELQTTVVFCTWSESLADLEEQAAILQRTYEPNEYTLGRPTGGQLQLFQAMLPGAPAPPVCRDYTQFLLPRDLAAGMPFAGSEVGDPRGMLLGVTLDGGTFRPALFDPGYGPAVNRSGSLGICGALGSGKSYLIKCVAHATLARGGQVVALDRTAAGEYVAFAGVVPGRAHVVRVAPDADLCLDPLRVFGGEARARYAIGFLTLLTGTAPTDLEGAALAEAVRTVAASPDARLADVVTVLERQGREDAAADVVHRKVRTVAASELGPLAFGDGSPLALDADYVVLHAPALDLPAKEVLLSEHLARQMLPEQVFSVALLYLLAAVAREVTFSDRRRFAAALIDEAWALTSSMQGRQLLLDGIRDGRKHNAGLWLISQHPEDLGDDALTHLLGSRFVFRQSRGAASAALRFLGLEPDEELVELVSTGLREGQCLYRDVRERTGRIQVLEASSEQLREAFETNPAAPHSAGEEESAAWPAESPARPASVQSHGASSAVDGFGEVAFG